MVLAEVVRNAEREVLERAREEEKGILQLENPITTNSVAFCQNYEVN